MSASERVETVQECLQRGAAHYILKPVTKKEVQNIWQHTFHARPANAPPAAEAAPPKDDPGSVSADTSPPVSAQVSPPQPAAADTVLSAGSDVPLDDVLTARCLPWRQRMLLFCQFLSRSMAAFRPGGTAAPFMSPAGAYVRADGFASERVDAHLPPPDACAAFYRSPSDSALRAPACVYALGVLLLELALAPRPEAARLYHLAALPALPVELLTQHPDTAILILRMTAPLAADRPTLDGVAQDGAVAAAFEELRALEDGDVMADRAVAAAVQFSFLCQAESTQAARVQALTHALAMLEGDIDSVRSPAFRVS